MKPDWPQVLRVLAGNLNEFPTSNDHDHSQLARTADLLLLAAAEFDQAYEWRYRELEDLERLLAQRRSGERDPTSDPDRRVSAVSTLLTRTRAEVVELQAQLEDGPDPLSQGDSEIRTAIVASIGRRSRVLEGGGTGW